MSMRALLRGSDGAYYHLAPKVTTIGRERCDMNIQLANMDYQHAVIEYSDQENCYVLQDLNTVQGTFVNDVRIQNAAVRLAPNDVIRFGYGGASYELMVENSPQVTDGWIKQKSLMQISYPPVQQRPAWTQPLTMLPDNTLQQQQISASLPQLIPGVNGGQPITTWSQAAPQAAPQTVPIPRPPLRTRPLSASNVTTRRPGYERMQAVPFNSGPVAAPAPVQRSVAGGWMSGSGGRTLVTSVMSPGGSREASPPVDLAIAQDREQKIMSLSEEISRLRIIENESQQKDHLLQQLQLQVNDLQNRVQQGPSLIMGGDADVTQKLVELENEVISRKEEVYTLKEQLSKLRTERSEAPFNLRQELAEKVSELNILRGDFERVKKDKNITSGLVTQMQRDMSNKDTSISKLAREIESLKKELRERDIQLTAMTAKVTKLKDNTKASEEKDARERELISLRHKFKTTENKNQEQDDLIQALRKEIETIKSNVLDEREQHKKGQTDLEQIKTQFTDIQRTERLVRVDMEQTASRIERFRSRLIQITYSMPGVQHPEGEINDDELLDTLKKMLEDRAVLTKTIENLQEQLSADHSSKDVLAEKVTQFQGHLTGKMNRLQENGRLCEQLKKEINILQSVQVDDSILWVKEATLRLLNSELAWEQNIEESLEKCGVNVKLSNEDPGKHIVHLYSKWEGALRERDNLTSSIAQLKQDFRDDLSQKLNRQQQELEEKLRYEVEKTKLEGERNLNRAIDEIKAMEAEKQENLLRCEKTKIQELEETIEQLRQSVSEQNSQDQEKLEAANSAIVQLEELRQVEQQLRQEINELKSGQSDELSNAMLENKTASARLGQEVEQYQIQVKQHSVTICTLEEKLKKIASKSKEYQEEISTLKKVVQELRTKASKPALPPKPKLVVQRSEDSLGMEQLITILRRDNVEFKRQLKEQQDVIMALRRDLSGASARLSDINGEMSESQKQEIERNKELLAQREGAMTEAHQQMAKLSKIIDKQKDEIRALEEELSKEKTIANKIRHNIDEKGAKIRTLESRLHDEENEQKKQLEIIDQEGRITAELTALGAQCRGERHEQVIMRQREALVELRSRAKSLEQARPPLPTHDQALQQVVMLKKELAEMRVNQALSEDKVLMNVTSLDREVHRARGMLTTTNAEADVERSAHRETMDALESSEASFLNLLRSIASALEVDEVAGLRPMAHIPKDERDYLLQERERACEMLSSRISSIRERISRKDELLQGYEQDLAKLRQAQELADKKSEQVEYLATDVRSKTEESHYLRESLNRTRDRLDQEKRLNTAIKQRKTFHLENESPQRSQSYHTRCVPTDLNGKTAAKQRSQREALKKKNYEVNTLKDELFTKDQELRSSQNRLYTLESSLGLERQIEVAK